MLRLSGAIAVGALVLGDLAAAVAPARPDPGASSHVARRASSADSSARWTDHDAAMFHGGPSHAGVFQGGGSSLIGLAWRVPTEGDVISSPTIAGGVVYVGSNDGSVYALDLATGRRRWRSEVGSAVPSAPAVGDGMVFAVARDGSLSALDITTGARRWRLATGPTLPFPWGHESGDVYMSSPTLAAGMVLFGAGDGGVYAVDPHSGKVRWRGATEGRVRSSPAVDSGRVFAGSFDGRLYCFDLGTGALRWRYETEGASLHSEKYGFDRRSVQSSPTVVGGVVYVGARDGFVYAVDAASGKLRWRYDHKISWINSTPAVDEGVIYDGSSDAHFVQALDLSGKELWRAPTQAVVWSSPALAGTMVYAGDGSGRLYALDRRTGKVQWTFRTASTIHSSPAVSGEYVVVGSTDGSVYALRADDGATVRRAVYFDSSALERGHVGHAADNARYLADRGYVRLDTTSLITMLRDRIADRAPSVIVFALDALPAAVTAPPLTSSLLRRYLDSGGKVVWVGSPPGLFPLTMPEGEIRLDWATPSAMLGVPHDSANFDPHGVRATAEGERWGLPARWREAWGIGSAAVTDVLGRDDQGLATAWVKSYGGPPGTGFVRVPAEDPLALYLASEFRGPAKS